MDQFGNQRVRGGDAWAVKFERLEEDYRGVLAPNGEAFGVEKFEVKDNHDGSYTVAFTPYESGHCAVAIVSMNADSAGQHVRGSPVQFGIKFGALDAANCRVEGAGLHGASLGDHSNAVLCGVEQHVSLHAFDLYRNQIHAGGDFIDARLVYLFTGKEFPATVRDNMDGTHDITYHTVFVGEYELHISAASNAYGSTFAECRRHMGIVAGGSWKLYSLDGPPCASATTASGRGVSGASAAGEEVEFVVRVRDRYGNPCTRYDSTAHTFEVSVTAGWDVPVQIRDHEDGRYTCTYTPGVEDEFHGATVYRVEVRLDGEDVLLSPFTQRVAPAPTDPSQCFATGIPRMLTVGETGEFLVQAVDVKGALRTRGLDNFTLDVGGNDTLYGDIKDLRNGSYLVRFRGEELSYYKAILSIALDGHPIRGSPFAVKVRLFSDSDASSHFFPYHSPI
jgi:hypothetical protein